MNIDAIYFLSIRKAFFPKERCMPCRLFLIHTFELSLNILFRICDKLLVSIKQIITSLDSTDRHCQNPNSITCNRKVTAKSLIALLLRLGRGTFQKVPVRVSNTLNQSDVSMCEVSKATLAKAKMKFEFQAFIELKPLIDESFGKYFIIKIDRSHKACWMFVLILSLNAMRLPGNSVFDYIGPYNYLK